MTTAPAPRRPPASMLTLAALLASLGGLLASAVEEAAAAAAAVPRSALGADDACDVEAGTCAVSALQVGSAAARGGGGGGLAAGGGAPGAAAEDRHQQPESEQQPFEHHPEDDPNWVWGRSVADRQQRMERVRGKSFAEDLFRTFAPRMVQHCVTWTAYFWPMMSFWSQEVLRRTQAMPPNADAATKEKLQKFAKNASYLMCDFWFDPRNGTEWSEPVAAYMRGIHSAPSTDLEMPKLDGFFRKTETMKNMWSADSCMFWASSLMCDLGVWSRERQGSKGRGDGICWDQVRTPKYGFSAFGASLQSERAPAPESLDIFDHDEYGECMEQPPSREEVEYHCPMFGHYHSGYLNVSDWGHGYSAGSSEYDEVLQCQAHLDIPHSAGTSSVMIRRPWQDNVTLMDPPEDLKAVNIEMNMNEGRHIFEHVLSILRERDEWRAHRGYKNMREWFKRNQAEKGK